MTRRALKTKYPSAANPTKGMTTTTYRLPVKLTLGQQKVLEGLDRGRRRAISSAKLIGARNASRVMDLALKDLAAGGPARGRAKRIAIDLETLGVKLSARPSSIASKQRSVKRILDRLSVCPIASVHNGENLQEVSHAK